MEYVLQSQHVQKRYRSFDALKDININVPKGSIYGLIGKNGAGKTTLIRVISGLQQPTSGDYMLYGIENTDPEIYSIRKRIGALVETPAVYKNLNARENLEEQYRLLGLPVDESIDGLLNLVGLSDTGKKKVKNFSFGMKQRLAIAIALCGNPDFLILDEPTQGFDPQGIVELRELLLRLNRQKQLTILISSHILDELAKIATHYGFIDRGKIIEEISADELNSQLQKSIRLKLNDVQKAAASIDQMGLNYRIPDEDHLELFTWNDLSDVILELKKAGCNILSIEENNQNLESYFLNLIGESNYE